MKKKLRILTLALVSVLAISCSSDDNSTPDGGTQEGKTKDIVLVLSQEENVFNIENSKETLESTSIVKYNYNEQYRLESMTLSKSTGEISQGDNIGDTKFIYNDKQQLIAIEYKGVKQNEFFYENGLLIKKIEDDIYYNIINEFKYDSNKRLQEKHRNSYKKTNNSTKDSIQISTYQYNADGLIEKVIDQKTKEVYAEITYDKDKSLFVDMLFNNQLQNAAYLHEIDMIYKPKHNIKIIKDNYNEYISTYEFDKAGYPIKETTTEKDNKSGNIERKTITTYTYKIVTVKK
ncbi:MAG: hypothetical protein LBI73_00390 [Myroides sp.]|jgi:hypothetical protein|nr:hypothetical protein [Myroides sp.]